MDKTLKLMAIDLIGELEETEVQLRNLMEYTDSELDKLYGNANREEEYRDCLDFSAELIVAEEYLHNAVVHLRSASEV